MSIPEIDFDSTVKEIKGKLTEKPKTYQEANSLYAYCDVWGSWLARMISERGNVGLPTEPYRELLKQMQQKKTELEPLIQKLSMESLEKEVFDIGSKIFDLFSINVDDEVVPLDRHLNFKCQTLGEECNLVKDFCNENRTERVAWLHSLLSCFTRTFNLSGSLTKKGKGAKFQLEINPSFLVRKRLLQK